MNRPTRLVVAVLAATAVSVPAATAQAATTSSSVKAHVKKSQGAQARVATLARRGDMKNAKRVLKVARREATVAARQARTLAVRAQRSDADAQAAIGSLTIAAGNLGDIIQHFADLLPEASKVIQEALAAAIPGSIAGRDQLVQTLTDLVSKLTGGAQALAAQALALLQTDSPDQVTALAQTSLEDLPAKVAEIIDAALKAASAALDTGLGELAKIIPTLPEMVQGPLTMALDTVKGLLSEIMPMITQTTAAVTGIVTKVIDMVTSLVGDLLGIAPKDPGTSVGDDSSSGGGFLSGLLDSITGLIPGFGGLFGKFFG